MKTKYNWHKLELESNNLEIVMVLLENGFDEKLLYQLMYDAHKSGFNKAHRAIAERLESCRPNKN